MTGWSKTLPALLLAACGPLDPQTMEVELGPAVEGSWPAPPAACELGPIDPARLLFTTTDFSTGALSILDTETLEIERDVAVGSTDAIPFAGATPGTVAVVHRFGLDYVDVWTDPDFVMRGQFPVDDADGGSPNPQTLAFTPDGHAWLTTLGTPWLRELDLAASPTDAERDAIDLSAFADADGNPEAGLVVACGQQLYVGVQRLSPDFAPVDVDMLVPIDGAERLGIDLDPDARHGQGLPLQGPWLRQLRLDPTDPDGRTLLGLTTGIERIDLVAGTVSWAVPQSVLATAGIGGHRQPQSFDVDATGSRAYLAAYDEDFSQVRLWTIGLDGAEPTAPVELAAGFDSVERTLELVGERLFYGSTRHDAPGVWVFDVSQTPPGVVAGPLSTGLPPYSMVGLP